MPLTHGTTLGPYKVTAKIGEGGMGEVWQARDIKLDRDVALKVLPEAFTADPDRLARFEREAKVLASLNHPNIGSIYGLEEAEGGKFRALVLELVEGPTLADRIKLGPIPIDEALPIAKQIAEALEAAHEQGVIHRDLKPANIKVKDDGTVKVLDFGLAKAFQPDAGDPNMSMSPTISLTAAATQMGMVIGTAAYMAPEQAKGLPVDKRADIWAYGAVLFEMLTGRKLFNAGDVSEMLASVLVKDPDISSLGHHVPAHIRSVVRQCLVKDPKERLRDIGDVRLAMKGTFETTASERVGPTVAPTLPVWQRPVPLLLALGLMAITGLVAWGLMRPAPASSGAVTRFPFILPEGDVMTIVDGMALSPDGRTLVYAGQRVGVQQLFVRRRDQMTVQPLSGTEGAVFPFFSPDGAWVGFFTNDFLKKVALVGGPPVTLSPVGIRRGATWGPDDTIVFSSGLAPGLMQVPAGGGAPRALTEPEESVTHVWPRFVPGGEAVLYSSSQGSLDSLEVAVVSLDTGEQRTLVRGTDGTITASGHLVFGRQESLWAVSFDSDRLAVSGEPVPMVEGVQVNGGGWAQYALADDGTLVYLPETGVTRGATEFVWVDRVTGEETPLGTQAQAYDYPRISPDGTRVAVDVNDQQQDIWVWDLSGETLARLTFDAAQEQFPVWTPDGQRVIFSSVRAGVPALLWAAADGTGAAEPLGESERRRYPQTVAPDGSVVVVREVVGGNDNLITVSLTGDPVSEDLLVTEFNESNAVISPDGRWFAYQSNASGEDEIYVRPFPDADLAFYQVSTTGGTRPLWAPHGSELFYEDDDRLLAVPVQTVPTFSRGTPVVVVEDGYRLSDVQSGRQYDIDPSGERFLLLKTSGVPRSGTGAPPSLTFVLNWDRELLERVPLP